MSRRPPVGFEQGDFGGVFDVVVDGDARGDRSDFAPGAF